ncbi:CaiB/BaiF CoA transferase family protein [Mesorhizobium sp. AR02]|uniref:CaiB/BaiF CoA transferase family protein n=1 Tax=Mesorhizobium sp. AR02 TaxID=2865837 RepID=UPI002160DE6D|nr:CoA transferase [Mesorhizobium sp. AR02]
MSWNRPLAGMRVLDFTRVLAGPYCTALLADLGADVIKVEPPAGDDYRHVGPFIEGESALFLAINRGKRSIALDLAQPDDLAIAQALAAKSDVVVENFRPGVAQKLGIGWEKLSQINPKLVYASISGFGQEGALAARPAYDIVLQAMSGIMSVTGSPDGPPTLVGESIADVIAGLFGSWSILAALVERQRTGTGRHIDLAMFDAMIAIQPLVVARYLASGEAPHRVGNRHALSAPFGAFQARDGMFVLAVLNNKLFGILAQHIGRPDLTGDERFRSDSDRLANEPALRAAIEGWSSALTVSEAVMALVAAGVPAAEIQDIAQALTSPHAETRGLLQDTSHPLLGAMRVPEQPARFSGVVRGGIAPAPGLNADRPDILAELGREN